MACKEGQFDIVELIVNNQLKTIGINLNAQHFNGITLFDFAVHVRLLYNSRVYEEGGLPATLMLITHCAKL